MQLSLAPASLLDALRRDTADDHQSLEDGLDLLSPPLDQSRFASLLERFYGFHAAFEPAALACPRWGGMMSARGKLQRLTADLIGLGRSREQIAALPHCADASDLARTPEGLLGALYVMEGSVLGGQVISRALAATSWAPVDGFGYFRPYGAEAGVMWRGFKTAAEAASHPERDVLTVAAARRTFAILIQWLSPAFKQTQ